jgi:hypothetical protein
MEKRKKYIEEAAERETVKLFNNSLLHPEFKYGFILGMTHADKVPFVKKHKLYDTISKEFIDKACKWLEENISPEEIYGNETSETSITYLMAIFHDNMFDFINDFRKAMEE